jgi:hypothetical protein
MADARITKPSPISRELDCPERTENSRGFLDAVSSLGENDPGLLDTIRQTLKTKRIHLWNIPDLITVQHPSPVERRYCSFSVDYGLGARLTLPQDIRQEAYFITAADIDVVTALITAKLRDQAIHIMDDHDVLNLPSGVSFTKAPRFTEQGLDVGAGTTAKSALTPTNVHFGPDDWVKPQHTSEVLITGLAAESPSKSLHEVVWEGKASFDHKRSTSDYRPQIALFEDALSKNNYVRILQQTCNGQNETQNESSADCQQLSYSIREADVRKKHATARPKLNTYAASLQVPQIISSCHEAVRRVKKVSLEDVLSFPPLPARRSNEWHIPLPPVDSPILFTSRSLFDLGRNQEDVQEKPTRILSAQNFRTSWLRSNESSTYGSRSSSIVFDPKYDIGQPKNVSTDSTVEGSSHTKLEPQVSTASLLNLTIDSTRPQPIDNMDNVERESLVESPSVSLSSYTRSAGSLSSPVSASSPRRNAVVGNSPSGIDVPSPVLSPKTPWKEGVFEFPVEEILTQVQSRVGINDECIAVAHNCDNCFEDPRTMID